MSINSIPDGHHTITPYLVIRDAAKLIEFLKDAFDAVEIERFPRPDGSIMHAEVRIGNSIVMMGEPADESDIEPCALHLYVADADSTYQRALQAGGVSLYEPIDQDYGDREAGVRDISGNIWYLATHRWQGEAAHNIPADAPTPAGLYSVTPYLSVRGACRLIDFVSTAFDAKEIDCAKSPGGEVLHAVVQIGDSMIEASDVRGDAAATPATLHLYVGEVDSVYKRAIQAGSASLREPTDQFYGDKMAGVQDEFGNRWWIATHQQNVSPEEMATRVQAAE